MDGFVVVLVISADQAKSDHEALVRISHDFEANTVGDVAIAIEHASIAAQRQLRWHAGEFRRERDASQRRASMRQV